MLELERNRLGGLVRIIKEAADRSKFAREEKNKKFQNFEDLENSRAEENEIPRSIEDSPILRICEDENFEFSQFGQFRRRPNRSANRRKYNEHRRKILRK